MHLSINSFGLWGAIQAENGRKNTNLLLDKHFAVQKVAWDCPVSWTNAVALLPRAWGIAKTVLIDYNQARLGKCRNWQTSVT